MAGSWSAAELPHRVSQKFVEAVLRRHAESEPLAQVRYGWRLESFGETPDAVEAELVCLDTGERQAVRADYLIGGDGARSTVRRALGIRHAGETGVQRDFFGGRMMAMYLRAPDFYRVVPHDRAWMYWAFNSERRAWLAAVDGAGDFAFHTQLKPGEPEEIDEHRARRMFAQAMGIELDFELLDVDTWIAGHALVAERFRHGRVLIGGDAAHLFTPAGGLGYNTAVEDAVNLGWKLAATLDGSAGPALLDSYETERHRLAVRNTGYARAFAESIASIVPTEALEREDEVGAAARRMAGEQLAAHCRREFNIPGVTFGGRYDGSPVIVTDDTVPPPDEPNAYTHSATPGGRAPHAWLTDGGSLFDRFGFGWTLLRLGGRDGAGIVAEAERRGVALTPVSIADPAVRGLYDSDLILIRPDQIVAWRHRGGDHDPAAIWDRLLGFGHTAGQRAVAA